MAVCEHGQYKIDSSVNHVSLQSGTVGARILNIKVTCEKCGMQFWFPGMKTGSSYVEPVTDTSGFQLAVPLVEANKQNTPDPSLRAVAIRNSDAVKGFQR